MIWANLKRGQVKLQRSIVAHIIVKFERHLLQIEALSIRTQSELEGIGNSWQGVEADRFREVIVNEYLPRLRRLQNELQYISKSIQIATETHNEAEYQARSIITDLNNRRI